MTSFLLEDFAEVGLQYFYFEKFSFKRDVLVVLNALFMIINAIHVTIRMLIFIKEFWIKKECQNQSGHEKSFIEFFPIIDSNRVILWVL